MIIMSEDISGIKYWNLTAISFSHKRPGAHLWLFKCDCGIEKILRKSRVINGETKSCGCKRGELISIANTRHGLIKHPLYRIFHGIKVRCYNEKDQHYSNYGALGVRVSDEWLDAPQKFIQWALDNGWRKGLQIDKDIIPQKLGIPPILYSSWTCSVVGAKENANCTRKSRYVTYNGETKTISGWSAFLVSPNT